MFCETLLEQMTTYLVHRFGIFIFGTFKVCVCLYKCVFDERNCISTNDMCTLDSYHGFDKVTCVKLCRKGKAFRKQGVCPSNKDTRLGITTHIDDCWKDEQCATRMKCCDNGRGRRCMMAQGLYSSTITC